MFDLEKAIADWRRRMRAGGVKRQDVLDELESHLRDDVEQLVRPGSSARESFEAAVERLGRADSLRREFGRAGRKPWPLLWKLKLILAEILAPAPSLNGFSDDARHTLEEARREAPRLHHNFVGTEHVLLALLQPESGIVPDVLKKMGVNRDDLRQKVEQWVSIFPSENVAGAPPYTPRVKRALRLAALEAEDYFINSASERNTFSWASFWKVTAWLRASCAI